MDRVQTWMADDSRCIIEHSRGPRWETLANPEHLAKLKEGVGVWNQWRKENRREVPTPDLSRADLNGADLNGADFSLANLRAADLRGAKLSLNFATDKLTNLVAANLDRADLREADLKGAPLTAAYLIGANLSGAKLNFARIFCTNLSKADLTGADLTGATLVDSSLEKANLTACKVYGLSAWDVRLKGAIQSNLVITPHDESVIQVDNLEVAQFVYLLLNNDKIRAVIDTITSKVVLILGRFTPERKVVLEGIREELRRRDYLPVLFDFKKPASKDLTGTISTLANMARFIIADLTDPNSVPHELATVAPNTVVPIQAVILKGPRLYPMFADLQRRHHWVLKPYRYVSKELLIANLSERVIAPAEEKAAELAPKRRK